ncbi:lytic transglycosylase domain-containing protein [Corallococcus terminator]
MSISPLQNASVPRSSVSQLRGGGVESSSFSPSTGMGVKSSPGLAALQKDGFEVGSGGKAHLGKLLESTLSVMNTLVQVMSQIAEQGGVQAPQGAKGASKSSCFGGDSGFSPQASSGRPPLDLNPTPTGPSATASPGAAPGIEGGKKLGGNLPPGLEKLRSTIESAAAKTGVPAEMLAAQIWQESRGNLDAVSTNGGNGLTDTGLMQVNPNTFKELQAKHPELQGKDLSDPETNILAGACYMKDMKEQFGGWDLALRAYNSGPNGVDRNNANAIPAGTGDATYVTKVKDFMNTLATGEGTLPA